MARKAEQRGQGQWLLTPRAIAAQKPRRKLIPVWTFDEPVEVPPLEPVERVLRGTRGQTRRKSPLPSRRGMVQNGVTQRRVQTRTGSEVLIESGVPAPARRRKRGINPMSGRKQEGFMNIMRAMRPGESAVFPLRCESARAMANRVFGAYQYIARRVDAERTRIWNLKGR